jgi:UDP-N-acetylglucosamine/UDP-N-acetylgalactosamine diphosphorylase
MTKNAMTKNEWDTLKAYLSDLEQLHLLAFWDQLDESSQASLVAQIRAIDFRQVQLALQSDASSEDWASLVQRSSPPPAIRLEETDAARDQRALAVGEQALRDGKLAVVLVAGGQGSRLGFHHPKGMYPIGPVSHRTLLEIHVDRLLAIGNRYDVQIPLYLMTSPATHEETICYFHEHDRLGLDKDQLTIFCQGAMPAVDAKTGRLILESADAIFLSPDGHGGTLAALAKHGCLDKMQKDGVEQLFYFQVDNPLVDIADPIFVGHHLSAESELTTQVVAKRDPREKVGVVVAVDGHLQIVEYIDLPEEDAGRRNADGSLVIWAGSIAVHMFDRAFLQRMAGTEGGLPWHLAHKRVPFINERGERITPDAPNAIKLETFIFDLLPNARNALVVEVSEADAFAPLKNASGAVKDTPETCQAAMVNRHRRWLKEAGAHVHPHVSVEISASFALDANELAGKIDESVEISADKYFVR